MLVRSPGRQCSAQLQLRGTLRRAIARPVSIFEEFHGAWLLRISSGHSRSVCRPATCAWERRKFREPPQRLLAHSASIVWTSVWTRGGDPQKALALLHALGR